MADHISIAKLMRGLSRYFHQALKLSPHLSVTGTGCLCAGSEVPQQPVSPSASLDWNACRHSRNSGSGDPNQ